MKDRKVWPTSWTPAVGGLIVCVCVRVRARVHACVCACVCVYMVLYVCSSTVMSHDYGHVA